MVVWLSWISRTLFLSHTQARAHTHLAVTMVSMAIVFVVGYNMAVNNNSAYKITTPIIQITNDNVLRNSE